MRCPTCGTPGAPLRRPCGSCGERPSLRAFGLLAFADDPDSPPMYRPPHPAELAAPKARVAAAGIDVSLAFVALLWSGAIGTDQAFSHPATGSTNPSTTAPPAPSSSTPTPPAGSHPPTRPSAPTERSHPLGTVGTTAARGRLGSGAEDGRTAGNDRIHPCRGPRPPRRSR